MTKEGSHQTQKTSQHKAANLAIRDTFSRRFLTLLALKTTARFYSQDGVCFPITRTKIVKTGPFVHLTEASTMQFVTDKTSIPVPKVHCSFVHRNCAYIVMERIQGEDIPKAWAKLSEDSRRKILLQLKRMMQELRALKPPQGTGVESCIGGSLRDSRIVQCSSRFGPFKTIQGFHLWLRGNLQPSRLDDRENDRDWQEIKDMAAKQDGPWPSPVFTHGDLNPFNILISGDEVVSIIDWEFSGWYPHYWEYTSAWYGNITRTEWQDLLGEFLDPFPAELEMEKTRQKWWGEV